MNKLFTFSLLAGNLLVFLGCSNSDLSVRLLGSDTIGWAVLDETGARILMEKSLPYSRYGIDLYDITSGKQHTIWESDEHTLRAAFHPSNADLVACCDKISIVLIDWKANHTIFSIPLEYGFVPNMAFSEDGGTLFVVHSFFSKDFPDGWDRQLNGPYCVAEIIKIDVMSQTITDKIVLENNLVEGACFLLPHNLVGIRYMGGDAEVLNLDTGKRIQSLSSIRSATSIVFIDENRLLLDGVVLAASNSLETVSIFDIKTGMLETSHRIHGMKLCNAGVLYNKSDDLLILSGSQDQQACLWHAETGKVVWSRRFGNYVGVAVSDNGKRAVLYSSGKTLLLEL